MEMTVKMIQANKDKLTTQQYKTLLGQCRAGDVEGAIKGFYKIKRRNRKNDKARNH